MAKPYSYDLRQKVIEAIEQGGLKKSEASFLFNISRNTIDLWLKLREETEDFLAKPNRPPGNNHKITDWEKFREFAKANGVANRLDKDGQPSTKHLLLRGDTSLTQGCPSLSTSSIGEKTQAEMAELWSGEISARTISRALGKIGWTRKKRLMATEKEMKIKDRSLESGYQP